MTRRLFVGVAISKGIKERIVPLYAKIKETGADINFVSLENVHITIKYLGNVEDAKIPEIKAKLHELCSAQKSFSVTFENVGAFPSFERIRIVWVGINPSPLDSLMKNVDNVLSYIKPNDHEEIPHMTIARVKYGRNKEQLQGLLKEVQNKRFGKMVVNQLVLYESVLTPEGPVYTVVKEFGLE